VHVTRTGELIAGRYETGELIGRGGMADVHAGFDRRLERPVAIKTLRPETAVRTDIRFRFAAEARAAAQLSHPNAVAVFDVGEHDETPFIVMERLPGTTLADRIMAGPVDPELVRRVARDVLAALSAAHVRGIVHRDVKPGNILLATDGSAKIADFGIAKSVAGLDVTRTGQLLGTPAYLAPERVHGSPATPRSDLYSLGVVLYEALTGTKPYDGDTPVGVAHAIQQGRHRPLHEARPDLDPRLVATVERAMASNPADRFDTAEQMSVALAPRRVDATMLLTPLPALPVDDTVDSVPMSAVVGAAASPSSVSGWRMLVSALIALIVLVAGGLALASGDRRAPLPSPTSPAAPTTAPKAPPTTAAATLAPPAPAVHHKVKGGGHGNGD
jgi:serine/threonine protein kinase